MPCHDSHPERNDTVLPQIHHCASCCNAIGTGTAATAATAATATRCSCRSERRAAAEEGEEGRQWTSRARGRRGVAHGGGGVADGVSGSADVPSILTSPQKKRMEENRQAAKRVRAAKAPAAAQAAVPIQDADSSAAPGHPRASPRLAKAAHQPGNDDCGGCGMHMPWDHALSSVIDHRHRCTSCNHVVHAGPYVCKDLGRPDTTLIADEGFYYCGKSPCGLA